MQKKIEQEISGIVTDILEDYKQQRTIDKLDSFQQLQKDVIIEVVHKLMRLIYPGYFRDSKYKFYNMENDLAVQIEDTMYHLSKQIGLALRYSPAYKEKSPEEVEEVAEDMAIAFFKKLPTIREYVEGDLEAAYDGDPAAYYKEEIVLSYPGMYAITVNRIAHE